MLVIFLFIFLPLSAMQLHDSMNTLVTLPKDIKKIIVNKVTTDTDCKAIARNLHALGKTNKSFSFFLTDSSFSKELVTQLAVKHRAQLSTVCPHDTIFAAAYLLNTQGTQNWIKNEYLTDAKNFKFTTASYFNFLNKETARNKYIKLFIKKIWPETIPPLICQRLNSIACSTNEYAVPINQMKKFVLSLMNGKLSNKFTQNLHNRPLFLALRTRDLNEENVLEFLKQGADYDACDPITGEIPLTAAMWRSHFDTIPVLCNFGANPNNIDQKGRVPLDFAITCAHYKNNINPINFLLEAGANPDVLLGQECTPLLIVIDMILNKNDKLKNRTALLSIIRSLLDHKADPNLPSIKKRLPLKVALEDAELVKILTDYGANPNKTDSSSISAFAMALFKGLSESAGILIEAGADIYSPITSDEKTPLEVAQKRGEHIIAQSIQQQQEKDKKDAKERASKKLPIMNK